LVLLAAQVLAQQLRQLCLRLYRLRSFVVCGVVQVVLGRVEALLAADEQEVYE
jgi:hypothetical protein